MQYHLRWCTKYRYPALWGEIAERCRDLLRQIAMAREITMRSILAVALLATFGIVLPATPATAAEPVGLAFDLAVRGKTITNKFSDINVWNVNQVCEWPKDYVAANFPFVQRIQLMAATGGSEQRDLFKNPKDRTNLADYDFSRLVTACEKIVAKGRRPMIKTGWVPLKLSANPHISKDFGTNVRPPADYDAYYAYIKAMAETLKKQFGVAEMKTWTWGVGVEYDNRDWFEADDGKPETTKLAYFHLYDTTVAALEDALGPENVTVGAHSMNVARFGFWDQGDFIEHCAKGENLRRGGRGTHLDFLAISYYTSVPGFELDQFVAAVDTVRNKARQVGLTNLKYGVDEGRVLQGWDKKVLYARESGHPIQAAGDAKLFHVMVDYDVDYLSTWVLTTGGLSDGLPVLSVNLRNLAFRMNGSALVGAQRSGHPADIANDAGGLAGYDAVTKTLRILLYNFNRDRDAKGSEDVAVSVARVRPAGAKGVTLRSWPLDEDHGTWWPAWQADVAARKMSPKSFKTTMWTLNLPGELTDPADVAFWKSRAPEYAKLGQLRSTDEPLRPGANDTIAWPARLKPNAVVLYELFPVEPVGPSAPSR
jgi:hypothetical protein